MLVNDIPFWEERINVVNESDIKYQNYVRELQTAITESLILYALTRFSLNENGNVKKTIQNVIVVSSIDSFIHRFFNNEGRNTINNILSTFDDVIEVNKKYFRAQTKVENSVFEQISIDSRNYTLTVLGIDLANGIVRAGSRLWDALMSTNFGKTIKSILLDAVENEKPANKIRPEIEVFGNGGNRRPGEYEKQVYNVLPNPNDVIENIYGLRSAIELGLEFARYQGGLMKTSRDFCIHRNDKIFHVSEIAKFGTPADEYGGYKNKSEGEFQGKTKVYNPFYDVGGYNCRHRYFYISKEYVYRLKPSLKNKNFDLPDFWVPQVA